ncbi:hypothetical protein H8F23_06220 [Pseudomonas sp. P155]|uniref:Uncharacterized protein n=1 Tax=Pseudomonas neuropathica TaxID=2730425 RepID=A0ABS0BJT8_9PSED|nr:hypothetical protein [Pseudomonas neuropathica]MBF6032841.1 hypothetical protein [Pseudomonas neuropathica]
MEDEIESQVWRTAQQACSKVSFARLLEEAVASFKRIPGLDPIVRLHASVIGAESIRVLRDVMESSDIDAGRFASYVELRSRLRMHLLSFISGRCHRSERLVKRQSNFNAERIYDEWLRSPGL